MTFPVGLQGFLQFPGTDFLFFEYQLLDHGQAVGSGAHAGTLRSREIIGRCSGVDVSPALGAALDQQGQVGQRLQFAMHVVHHIGAAGMQFYPVLHLLLVGCLDVLE